MCVGDLILCMDAEVLSVLRRGVLDGVLEEARAEMAVEDLAHWPVDRISHDPWLRWPGDTTGTSAPMMPSTSPLPVSTGSH